MVPCRNYTQGMETTVTTWKIEQPVTDERTVELLLRCALELKEQGEGNQLPGAVQVNGTIDLKGRVYFMSVMMAPNDTQTHHVNRTGCLFYESDDTECDYTADDLQIENLADLNGCEPLA